MLGVGSEMRRSFVILMFAAVAVLLSACETSQQASRRPPLTASRPLTFASVQVPPARLGQVFVIVGGGPVRNKGEHWFPEGSTLATVLDWAGLDAVAPPRNVFIVDADGHSVRCRVAGRPRKELEQVKIHHGTRIVVPWDRCFGLGPNKPVQATAAAPSVFSGLRGSPLTGFVLAQVPAAVPDLIR
jgi:hypothetical protein